MASTEKIRRPKWHLVYYILAIFDLATISGSLYLNHQIMGVYTGSVDANKELAEVQGRFIDLGRLASAVNAPGNDVFDTRKVDPEIARRNKALKRFDQSMSILRAQVVDKVGADEADPLLLKLDDIDDALRAMVRESDLIFFLFRENRTDEAGRRMATMDRTYARVTGSVADASTFVSHVQAMRFDEQLALASSLRRFEYLFGGIIAVMVCLITLYGHIIAKKMKQMHTESLNTRLGRIVEDSLNEIYVFDAESLRFLQANGGARENLGYSMDELYGMTMADLLADQTVKTLDKFLEPLRDGARNQLVFETTHTRKDNSTYNVEVHLQLTRAETPPAFVAIVQDITEIRAHKEQLQHAQKMDAVGQLTGGVAHDFNNLLTVITGNLELLEARVEAADQRHLIEEAQEAAGMGAKLTQQLLIFARRQPMDSRRTDLNDLVLDMTDWLRRTLGETVQIRTNLGDNLNKIWVDRAQLKNAILNLALNARDAMPSGGTLTIETSAAEIGTKKSCAIAGGSKTRCIELSVTDTGTGMPPEVVKHAFEPFFTTKGERSGSGLGLSMVYGFAKQSGGHIELHSTVAVGTTVTLCLPEAGADTEDEPAQGPSDTRETEMRGKGEAVLVVEDNPRVRRVTTKRLTDLGYVVLEAEDGRTALDILEAGQPVDLLFTDVLMPGGMTGGDLAGEARQLRPGIKVLYTSGYTNEGALQEGLLDEGSQLLAKPYSRDELIAGIRTALDN